MKTRRAEIQVFSVSFLDVLSCALGGVLMLFIATMAKNQDEVADAHAAIGLKGPMKNVAFLFDTSGSMQKELDSTEIEPRYLKLLESWVETVPFERFNVIDFDTVVKPWSPAVSRPASDRPQAIAFIGTFEADGFTNTLGALQQAFQLEGIDTIILFSDGAPTAQHGGDPFQEVKNWLHENNRTHTGEPKIVINTIGMGNYFASQYGVFLRDIAHENGGEFIGR